MLPSSCPRPSERLPSISRRCARAMLCHWWIRHDHWWQRLGSQVTVAAKSGVYRDVAPPLLVPLADSTRALLVPLLGARVTAAVAGQGGLIKLATASCTDLCGRAHSTARVSHRAELRHSNECWVCAVVVVCHDDRQRPATERAVESAGVGAPAPQVVSQARCVTRLACVAALCLLRRGR